MRTVTKLFAGAIAGFAATAMAITPAMAGVTSHAVIADPTVKPPPASIVGVGANTTQYLFDQFSNDYNATKPSQPLYSWDATPPSEPGNTTSMIVPKSGCKEIGRPNGSSSGISALAGDEGGATGGYPCLDFARSSRPRESTDPPYAKGGVAFVALAEDAITWSTYSTSSTPTDAPASLTTAQLNAIYLCKDTNWDQVGGKNAPIKAFIPQSGSGTASVFLADIDVTAVGPCVSNNNNTLEENEGFESVLHTPEAIFPYSIGAYVSQAGRSAPCLKSGCTPEGGVVCKPTGSQLKYGCNVHGSLALEKTNSYAPTVGSGTTLAINPKYDPDFFRTLYDVVRYDPSTSDHIPGGESGAPDASLNLEKLFAANGWICTNSTAKSDVGKYGFITLPTCGQTS